tara:strand:- start:42 stop:239 length:198 start_codon:yes stop_codon:yes gene_type:complete
MSEMKAWCLGQVPKMNQEDINGCVDMVMLETGIDVTKRKLEHLVVSRIEEASLDADFAILKMMGK